MRRRKDFGHLKLLALFLFVSVGIPAVLKVMSAGATGNLGDFEAGETGIKVCAVIANGFESSLRFHVSSNQGFNSDILVDNNSCKLIKTEAATYTVRHFVPQEYTLTSVTGGTVSADNTPFIVTASGQYKIIYTDTYTSKKYLKTFGYTNANTAATAVRVSFDANGGAGSMNAQNFGLNSQQPLTANAFTRTDYAFTGWNTAADGSGQSYTDEQSVAFANGGELTLFAQWRQRQYLYNEIVNRQNNGVDTNVDFTAKATITDGNGNGLNIRAGTENDQYPIYYFRGEISDNNVIWADKCWKIVRTTATGGTKMIYNGLPSDVVVDGETAKQCNATNANNRITVNVNGVDTNTFRFNNNDTSPADVGYMYGARIDYSSLSAGSSTFVFSNNVSRSGNTYTLDTSTNQSISGTWADERTNAAVKYHYFCTDGASVCDNTKISYIYYFGDSSIIHYLSLNGYDDIEDAKAAMFANINPSNAKTMVETWFEQQNLYSDVAGTRNYEDNLEDTVFCSDRTYYSGALKDKDSDAGLSYSYHGAVGRNMEKNARNNYEPSLDCVNPDDAFTKDGANGNGKLKYKIGLITADELTMAGTGYTGYDTTAYLYSWSVRSASPGGFGISGAFGFYGSSFLGASNVRAVIGLRPLVSLKSNIEFTSGTGLQTDPYIVE